MGFELSSLTFQHLVIPLCRAPSLADHVPGHPHSRLQCFCASALLSLLLTGPACYLRYIAPVFETRIDPTIVHKVFCIQSWVVLCATWLILRLFLRCEAAKIQIFVSGDDFLSQTHPCVMVQAVS